MRLHRAADSFSMTEILVVVAVILVLISLLIVGVESFYAHTQQVKCQHRLEQIGHACEMYALKHHGQLLAAWDMHSRHRWYEALAEEYLDSDAIIACPLEPDPPKAEPFKGDFTPNQTIINGLEWLKEHQEPDGHWEVYKWGGISGSRGTGYHTGVTAIGLMAFLGYGCTDRYPSEYAETVEKAIAWLLTKQVASGTNEGKFNGYNSYTWYQYDHGTATMAMCQAYAITGRSDCKAAAVKALKHLLVVLQATDGAFGYDVYQNDVSVTGWCMQALHAGTAAGLQVMQGGTDLLKAAKPKIGQCLENMVYPGSYCCYYRYGPEWNRRDANLRQYAATAISLTSRLLMGHTPGSSPSLSNNAGRCRGVLNFLRNGSNYRTYARSNTHMLYYYYYMTLANSLLQDGGWEQWCAPQGSYKAVFPDELAELQDLSNTDYRGSWAPSICQWGGYGGRAYTTGLSLLSLEAGIPGHWDVTTPGGACSYGYNPLVGESRQTPAGRTILVADAINWLLDPEVGTQNIAARHSGRANVLLCDGHVQPLLLGEITPGMWTPEAGD